MRNLKRALSLAMATVMLLGMMVVGASADFKDQDAITNTDAVAVTSALEIFKGTDSGNFEPNKVVTRAEMAVIVCKMLFGDDLKIGTLDGLQSFSDVPAWAEGYVNLCASLKIVAGVGGGKFAPDRTVTTAEASVMLLKALGYYMTDKNALGADWALTAVTQATRLGLLDNVNAKANEGLIRDKVAVAVFNTITKAVPVEYNEYLGYHNADRGAAAGVAFRYDDTLAYSVFDLVYRASANEFGQPTKVWGEGTMTGVNANGEPTGAIIPNAIVETVDDAIATYTAETKNNKIFKDAGKPEGGIGVTKDGVVAAEADEITEILTTDKVVVANGQEGFLYKSGTNYELVIISYHVGEISKVTAAKGDKDRYVTVSGAGTFETEQFAKKDMVVYTMAKEKIQSMILADKVQGKVTSINNKESYLHVDGEKYVYSAAFKANGASDVAVDSKQTFYLCPNGFILSAKQDEAAEAQYLYVASNVVAYLDGFQARVMFQDGKIETVELESDDDEFAAKAVKGQVYKYTEEDELYTLKALVETTAKGATIKTDERTIAGADIKVDADTVFVDVEGKKAYTGFDTVPNFNNAEITYVLKDSVAVVVFITKATQTDDASRFVFFKSIEGDIAKKNITFVDAYIDGEQEDVIVDNAVIIAGEDQKLAEKSADQLEGIFNGKLFEIVTITSKGVVTELKAIALEGAAELGVGSEVTSKAVYLNGAESAAFKFDSKTVFIVVTYDEAGTKIESVASGSSSDIYVKTDKTGEGDLISSFVLVDGTAGETAKVVFVKNVPVAAKVVEP